MMQSSAASCPRESITIAPITTAAGTVQLPGSKSISNRALFLAAMAQGKTTLTGLLRADDTERMLDALKTLGIPVSFDNDTQVTVTGCGGRIPVKEGELFIGNAGTATRTLTALLAFAGGNYRIDGVARMRERPIGDLLEALRSLGAKITCEINEGFLPLTFEPAFCVGSRVSVRGNVSSQYLTALLMLAPTIASEEGFWIDIKGELISRPYVEMTVRMMRDFGIEARETATGAARNILRSGVLSCGSRCFGCKLLFGPGGAYGGPCDGHGRRKRFDSRRRGFCRCTPTDGGYGRKNKRFDHGFATCLASAQGAFSGLHGHTRCSHDFRADGIDDRRSRAPYRYRQLAR